MGMFDYYVPKDEIHCPECKALGRTTLLKEWQGKRGVKKMVTYREGEAVTPREIWEHFHFYSYDCKDHQPVYAYASLYPVGQAWAWRIDHITTTAYPDMVLPESLRRTDPTPKQEVYAVVYLLHGGDSEVLAVAYTEAGARRLIAKACRENFEKNRRSWDSDITLPEDDSALLDWWFGPKGHWAGESWYAIDKVEVQE